MYRHNESNENDYEDRECYYHCNSSMCREIKLHNTQASYLHCVDEIKD